MAVEKVLMPMGSVRCVCRLCIKTHDCGEQLSEEKDREAHHE